MKYDIAQLKSKLPMPDLMDRLGMGGQAKRKAHCPFHADKNPSFSVFEGKSGQWIFKCHAGCGEGDEINLIKLINPSFDDSAAIQYYAEMAGMAKEAMTKGEILREVATNFPGSKACNGVGQDAAGDSSGLPAAPSLKLERLSAADIKKLAEWRGYSPETITHLVNQGLLGKVDGQAYGRRVVGLAFPTQGGFHIRDKNGDFMYSPGATPSLFQLGEIEEGAHIHCFESQWDAIALADVWGERDNIVATRGSANVAVLKEKFLNFSGTLYLWPQNDREHLPKKSWPKYKRKLTPPSEIWLAKIRESLPGVQLRIAATPTEHKDLNDWRKAGATLAMIHEAFMAAKDFLVSVLAEPAPHLRNEGEARESTKSHPPDRATPDSRGEENNLPAQSSDNCTAKPTGSPPVGQEKPDDDKGALTQAQQSKDGCESGGGQSSLASEASSTTHPKSSQGEVSVLESSEVSLAETLDKIVDYLGLYTVFSNKEQADACALWAAHTYIFDCFDYTPILHIYSPEKGCGKSNLLNSLGLISNKPSEFVNTSEAALYREIQADKPTMLWDEIDQFFDDEKSPIIGILNAGYERTGKVKRCRDMGIGIETFEVFCPKALTGIGKIPDTVHSRSLDIRLIRESKGTGLKFRRRKAEPLAKPLRDALAAWSEIKRESLRGVELDLPEQLSGRQQDITEPLFAVAADAGEEWLERATQSILRICAANHDQSLGISLLSSIREAFYFANKEKMATNELIARLVSQESANAPWPGMWERDLKNNNTRGPAMKLAELLGPYDIQPRTIRDKSDDVFDETKTMKGYHRQDFEDAWRRYLEPIKGLENMELGI